jgi:hypothetical protein
VVGADQHVDADPLPGTAPCQLGREVQVGGAQQAAPRQRVEPATLLLGDRREVLLVRHDPVGREVAPDGGHRVAGQAVEVGHDPAAELGHRLPGRPRHDRFVISTKTGHVMGHDFGDRAADSAIVRHPYW